MNSWRLAARAALCCLCAMRSAGAVEERTYNIRLDGDADAMPQRVCVLAEGNLALDPSKTADTAGQKWAVPAEATCSQKPDPVPPELICADKDLGKGAALAQGDVLVLGLSLNSVAQVVRTVTMVEYAGTLLTLRITHKGQRPLVQESERSPLAVIVRGGGYKKSVTLPTLDNRVDLVLTPLCEAKLATLPPAVGINRVSFKEKTDGSKGLESSGVPSGDASALVTLRAASGGRSRTAHFIMADRSQPVAEGDWREGTRWSPESSSLDWFRVKWAAPANFPEDAACPDMTPLRNGRQCAKADLRTQSPGRYCQYYCDGSNLADLPAQVRMATVEADVVWLDEVTAINQTLRGYASPAPTYIDFTNWKPYFQRGHGDDEIQFVEIRLPNAGTYRIPVSAGMERVAVQSPELQGQTMVFYRPVGDRPYPWTSEEVKGGVVELKEPQAGTDANLMMAVGGGMAGTIGPAGTGFFDYYPSSPYFEFALGVRVRPRHERMFFDLRGTYLLLNQPYVPLSTSATSTEAVVGASLTNRVVFGALAWHAIGRSVDVGGGLEFGFVTPVELDNEQRTPFLPVGGPVFTTKWSRRRAFAAGLEARLHFSSVRAFTGGDLRGQPSTGDSVEVQFLGGLVVMVEPWTFTE